MLTGAEIGVYNIDLDHLDKQEIRTNIFYHSVEEEDFLELSFELIKGNEILFSRKAKHWWLTGFRLGEFSHPEELILQAKIELKDIEMRDAFICELEKIGYSTMNYGFEGLVVMIIFSKPFSEQAKARIDFIEKNVQENNKNLCDIYNNETALLSDAVLKLEYLKDNNSDLYNQIIKIGNLSEIYSSYDQIKGNKMNDKHERPIGLFNKNLLNKLMKKSKVIPFDNNAKMVFFSDCHRSNGSNADNFARNYNLFYVALKHYYDEKYTYFELGDGDELWEESNFSDIIFGYSNLFRIFSKFYAEGRYHQIYGNHDLVKRNKKWIENNYQTYSCKHQNKSFPLFPGIEIDQSLVLRYENTGDEILLIHGHQQDFFNNQMWRLSKFLVKYLWKPLQLIGIQDPQSTVGPDVRMKKIESALIEWTQKNNKMIIAGHTHRAIFPENFEHLYFNDGCSVHNNQITAIEIENGEISLVKWCIKAKNEGELYVGKDIFLGPLKLETCFDMKKHKDKVSTNYQSNLEKD